MENAKNQQVIYWGIGIGTPLAFYALVRLLPSLLTAGDGGVMLREFALILTSVVWLACLAWPGPLSAQRLGLTRIRFGDLGWAIVAALVTLVASISVAMILHRLGVEVRSDTAVRSLATRPSWLIIVIVLVAAVSEEAVFRAVVIAAIEKAKGGRVIAVIVSMVCFAVPHMSVYGPAKVLIALVPALVMAGLFLWRRNLLACIVAHALVDLVGVAGLLFRHHI